MINMVEFKRLRAKACRLIKQSKHDSWIRYTSSLTGKLPSSKVWQRLRRIAGKGYTAPITVIKSNGQLEHDKLQITNILAEQFATVSSSDQYSAHFLRIKLRYES